ncbi:B isoform X1 [Octopus vulgaris]|uniref:Coactosin-like protein n=1 Tax=Octopus vulgaris TaxID=6645 RepID=A0AA36FEA3_OCTVU|nr:B isoform X1 [Octopus vulgaris]
MYTHINDVEHTHTPHAFVVVNMAIDLSTNRDSLLEAYRDVADDKTNTNWALFGYVGTSDVLKVVERGSDGIEELVDEVNSSKVQYAYCRVKDPNTDLSKYVLINWQGEGAPENMKFKCTNHVRDVKALFKGVHLVLSARSEDDLDEEDIKKKLAKSSGSNYSFHKEQSKPEPPPAPVGSVYQKTYAKKDINTKKRDEFWAKTEEEEKKRQQEDRDRLAKEKDRLEQDRKKREEQETAEREKKIREKMKVINQQKVYESKTKGTTNKQEEKENWAKMQAECKKDEEERKMRSESLRKERVAEAQHVVSNKTQSKRALFEQRSREVEFDPAPGPPRRQSLDHYVDGYNEPTSPEPISPTGPPPQVPPSLQSSRHDGYEVPVSRRHLQQEQQPQHHTPSVPLPQPVAPAVQMRAISPQPEPADTAINLLRDSLPRRQTDDDDDDDDDEEDEDDDMEYDAMTIKRKVPVAKEVPEPEPEQPAETEEEFSPQDKGMCVRALYDYQAADDTEISFDPDDIITNVEQFDEGWWNGISPSGEYGMFPANYVEVI